MLLIFSVEKHKPFLVELKKQEIVWSINIIPCMYSIYEYEWK